MSATAPKEGISRAPVGARPARRAATSRAAPRWLTTLLFASALGLAALCVVGTLGGRLGFGAAIGFPGLEDGHDALSRVVGMFATLPDCVLAAGLERPVWLVGAFGALACPVACLAAIVALRVSAARPARAAMPVAVLGAILACIGAVLALWWIESSTRAAMIEPLPGVGAELRNWLLQLQVVAAIDVLLVVSALLWSVLALVLDLPAWIRTLAGGVAITALLIASVGSARTLGTVAGSPCWPAADRFRRAAKNSRRAWFRAS